MSTKQWSAREVSKAARYYINILASLHRENAGEQTETDFFRLMEGFLCGSIADFLNAEDGADEVRVQRTIYEHLARAADSE